MVNLIPVFLGGVGLGLVFFGGTPAGRCRSSG